MSSYFDEASLVMIPSGYKDQKVYSVKPLDGAGDLVFSRASSATRVASNGLIEKVRTNLILQSQDFSTTWSANSCTVATNTTANPLNGAVNADTITFTGGTTQKYVIQAFSFNGNYTVSAYLKAGTNQFVQFLLGSDAGVYANFDLVNGTASAAGSTATIVAAGGGFFRCSMSFTSTTGTHVFIQAVDSLSAARFATTTSTGTLIAFGYQLEVGDIATDYIATTSAAVSVGPVSGLPRLDYLNSTCPRLLLEPQRTNALTYSEQIDNADWLKLNSTIAANTSDTLDPAGYNGADKITDNSTNASHFVYRFSAWDTTQRTASVYAKAGTSSRVCILNGTTNAGVFANLSSGTISVSAGYTGTITSVGNGWYRITATHTAASSQTFAIGLFTGTNTTEYVGTGSYAYLWGAQLEAGAYATSYIPTLGTSVTRVADAASKTGISSLIGQTEGVVFVDFTLNGLVNFGTPISVNNGTDTRYIWFTIFANGTLRVELYDGAVQSSISFTGAVVGGRYKMAFGYKTNDFALYVNGALVGTDLVGTTFSGTTLSRVDFDLTNPSVYSTASESINQALLFKTRLTNSQLAELTSL